jgi:hypothetical protein
MPLRDRALKALRDVFGAERAERDKAESPSAEAMRQFAPSMFSIWGREDIGGLLTVSQSLMDRFADYEAMEEYPDINSAYHFYANDATQPSVKDGRTLWVSSNDRALQGMGDDLIHRRLRAESEIWSQAYTLGLYGNDYEELLVTENGVVGLNHLPVPTMRRVERLDGALIGYVQDVSGQFTANAHELRRMLAGQTEIPKSLALFEDWQVVHYRLTSTRRRSPYGRSVAEGARWIWKRLVMLEDSVMIYKLTRAPARYAFYVDVTDVPSDRVEGFLRKAKRDLKKKKMVDPRSGRLDMRYNVLSRDEDFFIAVREGRELARVEVLSGPDYQAIDDVEYFKRMLHGSLRVPREYLGQEGAIPSKSLLSNDDVRAARVTMNLQRELRLGWERIIRTHLAARGLRNPWAPEFQVEMTLPSGIWELAAYEVLNARADYASRIQPWVSTRFIQENVLQLTDEQIKTIEKEQKKDAGEEQAGELPSYAMPTGGGGPPQPPGAEGGEGGEPGAQEGPGAPEQPAKGAPEHRWTDYHRRLEEWRHRESNRRHAEIMDTMHQLRESDPNFFYRDQERRGFFRDLTKIAMKKQPGGHIAALETANGNGRTGRQRTAGPR